jgi:hypothetical protein
MRYENSFCGFPFVPPRRLYCSGPNPITANSDKETRSSLARLTLFYIRSGYVLGFG